MKQKDNEKELQERYIELQTLALGLKELQKNIELVDEQIIEIMSVAKALKELKDVKIGTAAYVPISSGIFVKAELRENDALLINVGAGVVISKSVPEAIEMLTSRVNELSKQRQNLLQELERLGTRAQELEDEINNSIKNV